VILLAFWLALPIALLQLMARTFAIGLGDYWTMSNFPFLTFANGKHVGSRHFRIRRWLEISGPIDTVAMARPSWAGTSELINPWKPSLRPNALVRLLDGL
jgi:hypothetical protein